jgi:hypothetical protein
MKYNLVILIICLLNIIPASAQEQKENQEEKLEKRHSLAFVFGYTHIPAATKDGKEEDAVFVPTIGLDYFYLLNEKWSVGGAFDMELSKYEVAFEEDEITREIAIVLGVLVGYEVLSHWGILAGPGVEFEKNKNLFVFRISTEYTFELGNDWGLYPSLTYDFKKEYSSYALGVGLKKRF